MANTGIDLATNAGRVNVPDATEETLSLVLAQTADAEEKKGRGPALAESPGSWEEMREEALLLWINEVMAGIEFLVAHTTVTVRESPNWGDQELEAVLVTGLSDIAVEGSESWVGMPTDKLLLVKRDGCGIANENKKLSSRGELQQELQGTTVTKTTSTWKAFALNQQECHDTQTERQANQNLGRTKRSATLL